GALDAHRAPPSQGRSWRLRTIEKVGSVGLVGEDSGFSHPVRQAVARKSQPIVVGIGDDQELWPLPLTHSLELAHWRRSDDVPLPVVHRIDASGNRLGHAGSLVVTELTSAETVHLF